MNNRDIHYKYIISYLLIAIILLIALDYYDVPSLVDKLSFALTLSSLLLAILAIFYTIISGHKQDSQFSKLIETNSELKATSTEIKSVSEGINVLLKDVPSQFKNIGGKIDNLSLQYESLGNTSQAFEMSTIDGPTTSPIIINEEYFQYIFTHLAFVSMGVLYLFSQAKHKGENIEFSTFKEDDICPLDYAIGFLKGFSSTGLIDFKVHKGSIIPTCCNELIHKNLLTYIQKAIPVIEEEDADRLKKYISFAEALYA